MLKKSTKTWALKSEKKIRQLGGLLTECLSPGVRDVVVGVRKISHDFNLITFSLHYEIRDTYSRGTWWRSEARILFKAKHIEPADLNGSFFVKLFVTLQNETDVGS